MIKIITMTLVFAVLFFFYLKISYNDGYTKGYIQGAEDLGKAIEDEFKNANVK